MGDEDKWFFIGISVGFILGFIVIGIALETKNIAHLCQTYKLQDKLCEPYMDKLGYQQGDKE